MKKTWYFGAFLILFTLLGFYQNQNSEPNQEIVLKFSDVDITSDEAQSAITLVKKQLQVIGVETVQVQELKEGQLKITYYSDEDVESIKKILSVDSMIEIGDASNNGNRNTSDFPSNKNKKDYKLDVFKISKSENSGSGLDGKCVLNLKQDYDRFHNPKIYLFKNEIDANANKIVKVAFKVHINIAVAIDNISRNIPGVRAGPFAHNFTV